MARAIRVKSRADSSVERCVGMGALVRMGPETTDPRSQGGGTPGVAVVGEPPCERLFVLYQVVVGFGW